MIEEHIQRARQLLEEARSEYRRAWDEKGVGVIIAWRSSYETGWLAVLEASNAFFLKHGVPQDEIPDPVPGFDIDRKRSRLASHYMRSEDLLGAYAGLWMDYHERLIEFEETPRYFEDIGEFIDSVEAVSG